MSTPTAQPLATIPATLEDQIRNTIYSIEDPYRARQVVRQTLELLRDLGAEIPTPVGPSLFPPDYEEPA